MNITENHMYHYGLSLGMTGEKQNKHLLTSIKNMKS